MGIDGGGSERVWIEGGFSSLWLLNYFFFKPEKFIEFNPMLENECRLIVV